MAPRPIRGEMPTLEAQSKFESELTAAHSKSGLGRRRIGAVVTSFREVTGVGIALNVFWRWL